MNNFNDENESVRDTLNRVMTDMGYFSNPVTINTPVGSRTFYEKDDSPLVKNSQQMQQVQTIQPNAPQFYIRDDKNYAWDVPHKYDRRPTIAGTWNNFVKINQENPIQKPFTTGNIVGDYHFMRAINRISPVSGAAILGANVGTLIGGYAGNLKRAYDEAHLLDKNNHYKNFILHEE